MQTATTASRADQTRALTLSTIAFTACFAVWTIFSIIGVAIKGELGLNDTQFGLLVATPILTGSLTRIFLGSGPRSMRAAGVLDANAAGGLGDLGADLCRQLSDVSVGRIGRWLGGRIFHHRRRLCQPLV